MKNLIIVVACLLTVGACKMDHSLDPVLNIDHPAAYIVNGESNSLTIIDLSDNTIVHEIKLGEAGHNMSGGGFSYPHHISINKTKTKLAIGVPNMDLSEGHTGSGMDMKGNIVIVDAITGQIIHTIDLPISNHNAIFSPDDSEIWTSQMEMNGKVLVYDANTYTLKKTIAVGMMPAEVTFSFDGKKAYVANSEDASISVIDVASKVVLATVEVGENPVGAWTGADNRMYVDNEDGQSISIIDVSNNSVVETIDLGFMPGFATFNQTKKELWVSDPINSKIHYWTLNAANNKFEHSGAFNTGIGAHAIAFSNDANIAYVTNQDAGTVSVINTANKEKIKDLTVGLKPNGIVIK